MHKASSTTASTSCPRASTPAIEVQLSFKKTKLDRELAKAVTKKNESTRPPTSKTSRFNVQLPTPAPSAAAVKKAQAAKERERKKKEKVIEAAAKKDRAKADLQAKEGKGLKGWLLGAAKK